MAPAFTEAALAGMEEYILPHIRSFFANASAEGSDDDGKSWTVDMGEWANFLTFDIFTDLAFGKDFGLLEGKESRELPEIVDAAVHRELLVSLDYLP